MTSVNIFAPTLHACESYGVIANQLVKHLLAIGVNAVALGVDRPDMPKEAPFPDAQGAIYMGWPTSYSMFPPVLPGRRIAITMHESSRCPDAWIAPLNTMDAVIVPSQFCVDVFRSGGVTAPIYVVALGVGEIYQPAERKPQTPMRFLAFLDRGERKGGLIAVRAFMKAFGDDPDYQLVLKMRRREHTLELLSSNIELIQFDMTEQELHELYCSCDVMIAPTACEGFGLLPREFAATGGIALATNYGGTADDLDQWGWPLAYTLGPANWRDLPSYEEDDFGEWAVVNVDALAEKLRDVADNRESYAHTAQTLAPNVHKLYSWRKFAEQVYVVWRGE